MGRNALDPGCGCCSRGEALGYWEVGVPDQPTEAKMGTKWVCGFQMGLAALREGGPPPCRSVTCTYGAPSGTWTPNPLTRTT